MKGNLYVIEGADAAGKKTQAELALAALRRRGEKVSYFDFPQYGKTMAGALVREALDGKHGDFLGLDPYLASLPYTLDRISSRADLKSALRMGGALCNRYIPSNIGFQGAKLTSESKQDEFIAWLEKLEYEEYGLPRPTRVFYLHVPYDFSRKLLEGRKGVADQHEKSEAYQRTVIDLYHRLCGRRSDWVNIECVRGGVLLSPADIHKEIMRSL